MLTKAVEIVARFFEHGGAFMYVILFLLAIAVAVAIERVIFYLIVCRGNSGRLAADLAQAIGENRAADAEKLCQGNAPYKILLRTALQRYQAGANIKEIRQGVEEAAIVQIPRFPRRLNYLSLFANIATLVGLIGTLFGLQKSFNSLAAVEAAQKTTLLANGIAEAMNTTAFGLLVAVPCMIIYTVLTNQQNSLLEDLDSSLVKFLNFLEQKKA
jgi:biopolymer transport protein ExbB/TolQ